MAAEPRSPALFLAGLADLPLRISAEADALDTRGQLLKR